MLTDVRGLHHVTGIVGDAQAAMDFYAGALGLRPVKRTVNFEDITQHHLYFGDAQGRPGTVFTVFPDPHADPGRLGKPQVAEASFAVPAGSLAFWRDRLAAEGADVEERERFGERALLVRDPVGTRLALVESEEWDDDAVPWTASVPAERAIRGLHSVTLLPLNAYATAGTLETLGFEYEREGDGRIRYRAPGDRATVVDLLDREAEFGREGPGTHHHVAARAASEEQLYEWRDLFADRGHDVSRVKDRHFFHSLYVREPGGILVELATDPDGLLADDPDPGASLYLPEFFERDRDLVERQLPELTVPDAGADP